MKKLLISILIILLIVLAYFAIFEGLSFGNLSILSVLDIKEANDTLISSIDQVNALIRKEYPDKKEELSNSIQKLLEKKEAYFSLAKISTEGEITKANTEESYSNEFLWTRVGRLASAKGVNIRMQVTNGDSGEANMKNIDFTVDGQYVGIIQFVSALENEDKLKFKIENFKMVRGSSNLTATFNVRNIRIKEETTTEQQDIGAEGQIEDDTTNSGIAEDGNDENTQNTQP